MNHLLEGLLEKAISPEKEVRDEACLQIAMLLEKHSSLAGASEFYRSIMPLTLFSLTLSPEELNEFLRKICGLVMARQIPPGILMWGLRSNSLEIVLETLLQFVSTYDRVMDEATMADTLMALDRCLLPVNQALEVQLLNLIRNNNPTAVLRKLMTSGNRNREIATKLLEKINNLKLRHP